MNVEKIITTTEPIELEITEIALLSKEEYEKAKENIPMLPCWWWLRSPGGRSINAAYVDIDGWVYDHGYYVDIDDYAVRPALKTRNLESTNLQIGDKVQLAGYTWTVISDGIILCDEAVGNTCFRKDWKAPDANVYEASDIKKWLENWAKEKGIVVGQ